MLKESLFISTVSALLLGCGSSDSTVADIPTSSNTEITVERGLVHGALVLDADGQEASFMGNGKYAFVDKPSYPVTTDGGYVDINKNGTIDAGEIRLQYTLQTQQGNVVTIVSTIASNSEIKAMIKEQYGLSDDDIDSQTPSSNKVIAAVSDEVYAYCVDNNLSPLNLTLMQTEQIRERIQNRINAYQESNKSTAELEEELVDELEIEKLAKSDLNEVNQIINRTRHKNHTYDQNCTPDQNCTNINDIPASELTDAQKEGLIFMLEEEKVARDVYEHLYNTWGLKIFTNIARSEQRHMDTIQLLVTKYALEAPAELETRGVFENSDLQALYDQLIAKGNNSLVDGLEVGVMVEETDIADLEEILAAGVPEDLKIVYENLLNSSYKHLDAFNNQLIIYQ